MHLAPVQLIWGLSAPLMPCSSPLHRSECNLHWCLTVTHFPDAIGFSWDVFSALLFLKEISSHPTLLHNNLQSIYRFERKSHVTTPWSTRNNVRNSFICDKAWFTGPFPSLKYTQMYSFPFVKATGPAFNDGLLKRKKKSWLGKSQEQTFSVFRPFFYCSRWKVTIKNKEKWITGFCPP